MTLAPTPPSSPTASVLCCSASRASCARRTRPLGVTSRQVTLLWLVKQRPGLSLRQLAAEERISAPALSGHVDRLERAAAARARALGRRPPPRRARRSPPTGRSCSSASAHVAPPGSRAGCPRSSPTSSPRSRPRSSRCGSCCDAGAAGAQRAHLRQPPPPPELPPLLHRPGDLGQRHLDAEHLARLARRRADRLADRRRRARLLPLRAVHPLRALRRRRRRPDRQPPARDVYAVRIDDGVRGADGDGLHALVERAARLRARARRRHGPRLRRARPPRAHLPDGRARRAPERRRAEREHVQRLACRRSRGRGHRDRLGRDRRLLPAQHDQLPGGAGRPAADAPRRALRGPPARRAADDLRAGSATCSSTRAATPASGRC